LVLKTGCDSGAGRLGVAVKGVQHGQLKPDGGDGGVDFCPPFAERFLKRRECILQVGDARVADLLGEGRFVHSKPILDLSADLLVQFIEHEVDIGVHCAEDVLRTAGVVEWFQRGLDRLI
jgi:hypothetical protein